MRASWWPWSFISQKPRAGTYPWNTTVERGPMPDLASRLIVASVPMSR